MPASCGGDPGRVARRTHSGRRGRADHRGMRRIGHVVIGLAAWAAFGALWWLLARDGRISGDALRGTAVELGAVAVVVLAVTGWWIRHNLAIHRRKGPRTAAPATPARTDRDALDRPV